jgi:Ca2+-binding RTX toxin-like protein
MLGLVAVMAPAGADGPQSVNYTCHEITDPAQGVPDFSAPSTMVTSDSVDPALVFQRVTWTADIELPAIQPAADLYLDYVRLTVPIPEGILIEGARLVAGAGETPNPPLSQLSIGVFEDPEIIQVDIRGDVRADKILVQGDGDTFFPANPNHPGQHGPAVVPPVIRITGLPTPEAAGTTIEWTAPRVATQFRYLGTPHARIHCRADGTPTILSTSVSTDVQQCDGHDVTVVFGYGSTTAGPDVIRGTPGPDWREGRGGADRFCGLGGNDTFFGGAGADHALGGGGDDRLWGNGGPDTLEGGTGDDALGGGPGNDTCAGQAGHDTATACEIRTGIP